MGSWWLDVANSITVQPVTDDILTITSLSLIFSPCKFQGICNKLAAPKCAWQRLKLYDSACFLKSDACSQKMLQQVTSKHDTMRMNEDESYWSEQYSKYAVLAIILRHGSDLLKILEGSQRMHKLFLKWTSYITSIYTTTTLTSD